MALIYGIYIDALWALTKLWIFVTEHATVIATVVSAFAAVAVARYTAKLTKATTAQAVLTRSALKLSRDEFKLSSDEFAATHRPKVFVQAVYTEIDKGPGPCNTTIEFIVVNGGENKAYLLKALAFAYIQPRSSVFNPDEAAGVPIFPEGQDLLPGERVKLKVHSSSIKDAYDDHFLQEDDARMFSIGRIEYAGKDAIVRVTGFCREYDRKTGAYAPVPNSEHEYAY